jgi:major outer membrane protein
MKPLHPIGLVFTIAGLLLCSHVPAPAQAPINNATMQGVVENHLRPALDRDLGSHVRTVSTRNIWAEECHECSGSGCHRCCPAQYGACSEAGFFAGVDFLLIRPHFSEAVAFARGSQTATSYQAVGTPLSFDYGGSLRAFMGYRLSDGCGELKFTYWHADESVSVDGTVGPGQFIADPFGNVVGTVSVVDPRDARFGGAPVTGGDLIQTRADVRANVYDLDFVRPMKLRDSDWELRYVFGARIADIDQSYESLITLGGATLTRGDFFADFIGVGPRLGIESRRYVGSSHRFSLFANGFGTLLVGEYDVGSTNAVVPLGFEAGQRITTTKTIPVLESEFGASLRFWDSLTFTAGWTFQAWFDLGTSGGNFGGFFAGADDVNIMSFDGLFLKADWQF